MRERRLLLSIALELHPAEVRTPGQRPAVGAANFKAANRFPPPNRLPKHPEPAPADRISKLPHDAKRRDSKELWKRAPEQHAPKFISGMVMVSAQLVSLSAGVMVTDRGRRVVSNLVPGGVAAEGIIRFFVCVEKKGRVSAQLQVSRTPKSGARTRIGAPRFPGPEVLHRQRCGVFVAPLGKIHDGELRIPGKERRRSIQEIRFD